MDTRYTDHKRIVLLSKISHHKEAECAVALLPGMSIELDATGKAQPDTKAAADAVKYGQKIAIEDGWQGQNIQGTGQTGNGYTTYNPEDNVFYHEPVHGDRFNLLIKDGEVLVPGDVVVPEGGGTGLHIKGTGAEAVIRWVCREAHSPVGENSHTACEYQG